MTEDTSYNGWANYATWRVNLEFCDDVTSSLVGEQTFPDVGSLADYLEETTKEWVDESLPADNITIYGWVTAFLADVDWREIAQSNAAELVAAEEVES